MQYKITHLKNTDYCKLKPTDPFCQVTDTIEADSKTGAVMELHRLHGMARNLGTKKSAGNSLPIVWEIKEAHS